MHTTLKLIQNQSPFIVKKLPIIVDNVLGGSLNKLLKMCMFFNFIQN